MAEEFHSGKGGTATVDGHELAVTVWDNNPATELARFRNSKTGNFTKKENTFQDSVFSITLDFDFLDNVFDSPVNVDIGAFLSQVKLYLHGTSGLYWHYPSAIVVSTPQRLEIDGRINTVINCEADGAFGRPGHPVV